MAFYKKKLLVRLRMCEKSSTFVAYFAVSPIWQAKIHRKNAKKHIN